MLNAAVEPRCCGVCFLLLAAKTELLGMLDAMLSEEWEAAHPVEAAERRRFVEGVLAMSKKRSFCADCLLAARTKILLYYG